MAFLCPFTFILFLRQLSLEKRLKSNGSYVATYDMLLSQLFRRIVGSSPSLTVPTSPSKVLDFLWQVGTALMCRQVTYHQIIVT
jgi:hypothetical protein